MIQNVLVGLSNSSPSDLTGSHGALLFTADDGVHGRTIWTTGTPVASLNAQGVSISAREGQVFQGAVATFSDSSPSLGQGTYTAVISWGDGTASPGMFVAKGNGVFAVLGTHTYAHAGSYRTGVQIAKTGGGNVTAHASASISEAPIYMTRMFLRTAVGKPFSDVVATFVDTNALAAAGDFTAVIDWGDGQSSSGIVLANPKGGFLIRSAHTYILSGRFTATVTLTEAGGATFVAKSLFQVDNPIRPAGRNG